MRQQKIGYERKGSSRHSDSECARDGRNSQRAIHKLTSQLQGMERQMNSMNDSGEFQEVESNQSGRLSYVPSLPATIPSYRCLLSRDKRLPLSKWNASGPKWLMAITFCAFDSPQKPFQRIHDYLRFQMLQDLFQVHLGTKLLL